MDFTTLCKPFMIRILYENLLSSTVCECWTLYKKEAGLCWPLWWIIFLSATVTLSIAFIDLWAPVCVRSANRLLSETTNRTRYLESWLKYGWKLIFDLSGRDDLFNWVRSGGWPVEEDLERRRGIGAVPYMSTQWAPRAVASNVWPFLKTLLPECCTAGTVQNFCSKGFLPAADPNGSMPLGCSWLNTCAQVVQKTQLASAGMTTCVLSSSLLSHAYLARGALTFKWTKFLDKFFVGVVVICICLQIVLFLVWRKVREKGKQVALAWRFRHEYNRLREEADSSQGPEEKTAKLRHLELQLLPTQQDRLLRVVVADTWDAGAAGASSRFDRYLAAVACKVDTAEFMKGENVVSLRKETPPSLKAAGLLLAVCILVGREDFRVDANVMGNILSVALCTVAGVMGHWVHAALDLCRHLVVFYICVRVELLRLLGPIGEYMKEIQQMRERLSSTQERREAQANHNPTMTANDNPTITL